MQLRTLFKCPAAKLLLIFIWRDIAVQAISPGCTSCGGSVSPSFGIVSIGGGSSSPSLWGGSLSFTGTGSLPLLLAFLCIKFHATNSMSLPRLKSTKFPSLFKKKAVQSGKSSKKERGKKKKKKQKKKGTKARKFIGLSDDEYGKSKYSYLSTPSSLSKRAGTSLAGINSRDSIKSALSSLNQNFVSNKDQGRRNTSGKRKSGRLGGNTNERSSVSSSTSLTLKDILLNENEEDALRKKILAKIDELDPLMCLPKVLCGYSNRQKNKKKYSATTSTTTTTQRPKILEGSRIDEYLQLLKIVGPKSKKKKEKPQAEVSVSKDKKKVNKKKESEEDDAQSGSDSSESDESEEHDEYGNRKKKKKRVYNEIKDEEENEDEEEDEVEDDEEENDEANDDEFEEENDDVDVDDMLDDEHVNHIIKREKMKRLMFKSGEYSEENWWDGLDWDAKYPGPYRPEKYPGRGEKYSGMEEKYPEMEEKYPFRYDLSEETGGGTVTKWLTYLPTVINKFLPTISWDGGKAKDEFKYDPFFTSFDGRSKTRIGTSRSLSDSWALPSLFNSSRKHVKKGRQIDLEQLFGIEDSSRQRDAITGKDPAEKFRMAVELGRRLSSHGQCDYIYNACPLNYEEIQAIITEPLKHTLSTPAAASTTAAPSAMMRNTTYPQTYVTFSTPVVFPLQHLQPQIMYHPHQYHQQMQPSLSPLDEIIAQVAKQKKPHKTTIHQALPSGEQVEINLVYANDKAKTGLENEIGSTSTRKNETTSQDDSDETGAVEDEDSSSSKQTNEHPFSHKVLSYTNYNHFPSDRYKVRRKNGDKENSEQKDEVKGKLGDVSITATGSESGSSSSSSILREDLNPSAPEKSDAMDILMRLRQKPAPITTFSSGKGKHGYHKQMLKSTSSPPHRHSSNNLKNIPRQKQKKENTQVSEESTKDEDKRRKKKKKIHQHNNNISSSNRRKNMKARLQLLQQQHHHRHHQIHRRREKEKAHKKKRKHKPHLHKQSSESREAQNRLRIRAPNTIYPVYGHPFPPPYASYYHAHPPTPSSPSFFSYVFGR